MMKYLKSHNHVVQMIGYSTRSGEYMISLSPVHTKTIVNANASKRKLFYAFRPSVYTKTMKTLTVNA